MRCQFCQKEFNDSVHKSSKGSCKPPKSPAAPPEKDAAKFADSGSPENSGHQNGMKWKNRVIPTRAPNISETSLDKLRSHGRPGHKPAGTIFGLNNEIFGSNDNTIKSTINRTDKKSGDTKPNETNKNCNVQYNKDNVPNLPPPNLDKIPPEKDIPLSLLHFDPWAKRVRE